jgi:hypothetical protein
LHLRRLALAWNDLITIACELASTSFPSRSIAAGWHPNRAAQALRSLGEISGVQQRKQRSLTSDSPKGLTRAGRMAVGSAIGSKLAPAPFHCAQNQMLAASRTAVCISATRRSTGRQRHLARGSTEGLEIVSAQPQAREADRSPRNARSTAQCQERPGKRPGWGGRTPANGPLPKFPTSACRFAACVENLANKAA